MTFPRLTEKEIRRAEKHMATPAFREAVEVWRKRCAAGEQPNFPEMAKDFGIPIQIVLAYAAKDAARQGLTIRPIGRPS